MGDVQVANDNLPHPSAPAHTSITVAKNVASFEWLLSFYEFLTNPWSAPRGTVYNGLYGGGGGRAPPKRDLTSWSIWKGRKICRFGCKKTQMANRCILWLWKRRENVLVLWFFPILKTAVKRMQSSKLEQPRYKLTKIVRTFWLAERPVFVRVCKHSCDVKMFCWAR